MAARTVFFRDGDSVVIAGEYIKRQNPAFQNDLQEAARQLSKMGSITGFRSGLLAGGNWSIWLEDEKGERHNFVLYLSDLDLTEDQANARSDNQSEKQQSFQIWVGISDYHFEPATVYLNKISDRETRETLRSHFDSILNQSAINEKFCRKLGERRWAEYFHIRTEINEQCWEVWDGSSHWIKVLRCQGNPHDWNQPSAMGG